MYMEEQQKLIDLQKEKMWKLTDEDKLLTDEDIETHEKGHRE